MAPSLFSVPSPSSFSLFKLIFIYMYIHVVCVCLDVSAGACGPERASNSLAGVTGGSELSNMNAGNLARLGRKSSQCS